MPMFTRARILRSRRNAIARKSKRQRQRIRMAHENAAREQPANIEGLSTMAGFVRAFPRANARVATQLAAQLQRNHGNYFTQRVLREAGLLKRVKLGPPAAQPQGTLQRCCRGGCDCSSKPSGDAQAHRGSRSRTAEPRLDVVLNRSRGSGQSLDPTARAKLEGAMGVDLRNVAIHADARADRLARSVAAEAFTVGTDIYFRAGRYDPRSGSGMHLLAHEISHVVQQSEGAVAGRQLSSGLTVSDPGDSFEREADRSAAFAMERTKGEAGRGVSAGAPNVKRQLSKNRVPVVVRSANPMMLQRKVFTDNSVPGWSVKFNPTAAVTPETGGQQVTHYDEDPDDSKIHQRTFEVAADSAGKVFIAVNMTWLGRGGGDGGSGPFFCNLIPPIPGLDKLKEACEKGGEVCRDIIDEIPDPILRAACPFILPSILTCFSSGAVLRGEIKKLVCGGGTPGGTTPVVASGKGNATLQVSYLVEKDGKMQVFGPGPISSSSGTGAQVVSPVQSTKEATPIGGEVSLAPLIHSVIGQQINDFQQLFDVTIRLPKPQPFSCCQRVFPFVVGTDRFQNEDAAHEQLFTWWQGLHPSVRKSVEQGETPIVVSGHASATGSQKFNLELSQKRANRVKNILQSFFGSDSHPNVFAFGKLLAKQPGEVAEERRADVKIAGEVRMEENGGASSCGLTNQPGVCDEFPV